MSVQPFRHSTPPSAAAWFARPRPHPQPALRLFCFPYSGAGASAYAAWPAALPPQVEVCPLQLPGRESRLAEPPYSRMPPLVEAIEHAIRPYLHERPFAFFGHSMGALVAFALARRLRSSGQPLPLLLAVAAHRAAHLPDRHPPAHALPNDELVAELRRLNGTAPEVLADPELLAIVLPTLRADFAVCETYECDLEEPLPIPIAAFGGLWDSDVAREELEAWREQTSDTFSIRMLPGDHFFLHSSRPALAQVLARDLFAQLERRRQW